MSYKTLTQIRSNKVLNCLKVAHEVFTWNGRKYHIVGRYGGHKWHRFWLKVLDAREAFPLSTRLWLARLFEANTSMNRYSKTYIRTYCKHYKTLHCLPCCSNTFTRKYLDLRETNHANQFQQALR